MPPVIRHVAPDPPDAAVHETARDHAVIAHEWLVTNGIGGYASGTIDGYATRRYHGLLIAALGGSYGRWLLLSHISERVRLDDGRVAALSADIGVPRPAGTLASEIDFALENGLPVWRHTIGRTTIEKRVVLLHGQNTTYVVYRLARGGPARLKLMPTVHSRSHDAPVDTPLPRPFRVTETENLYEVSAPDCPVLRLRPIGPRQAFTIERRELPEIIYPAEEERGHEHQGPLWSPGYFRMDLTPDEPVALVASSEPWDVVTALDAGDALAAECERRERLLAIAPPEARSGIPAELVLASDQFLIRPVGRTVDAARLHAEGDDVRSVIAGYHWFTDWGRDTMIALEGLTLDTGRHAEAGCILRTFAHFIKDGLLPNLFPEGNQQGLYHTADATLWLFHALDRYLAVTGDDETLDRLLPKLEDVVRRHVEGTRFGIGVDPADGLLRQGEAGYQLTWMDAKVGDWVVTPRRGKAVEINALWYNALSLLAGWLAARGRTSDAARWRDEAARVRTSFDARFWSDALGYLFDVVDGETGDDPACRPNQIFAISLPRPVLDARHWRPVFDVVTSRLLTPVGLRSLAPEHEAYQPRYHGDLLARDAAYHQGTVWAWLIGPYIDAWLKVDPDNGWTGARRWLERFASHLGEAGLGTISEVFDAEAPHRPRGCIAQAWSVAEVLRCWLSTAASDPGPHPPDRSANPRAGDR